MIGWMAVKIIEMSVLFQWMIVRLFNMADVILNQMWIDSAIRYFAMVIWCLALMVITVTIVMILFSIIVLMTSSVLYLAFNVETPASKVFVIY